MIRIDVDDFVSDTERFLKVLKFLRETPHLQIGSLVSFKEGTNGAQDGPEVLEIVRIEIRAHDDATQPFELQIHLNGMFTAGEIDENEMMDLRPAVRGDLTVYLTDPHQETREEAQRFYKRLAG